ncbi:MAG: hypothetical protein B7Y39_18250 [Bdellovibrio sp. 28-41-41]|nr:MAG: hypothetical protein B7Y39_18250 [Bdellovibrio sp. 28-41-41]
MEMRLGHTENFLSEIKVFIPSLVQIKKLYMNSFLKLLFIPVLFALSAYAMDYTDVRSLRAALDPVFYKFAGVEGSMIGRCQRGTDKDPFQSGSLNNQNVDICLVYLVKDEALIPSLRARYKMLRIQTPIAVRFQKSLPAVVSR